MDLRGERTCGAAKQSTAAASAPLRGQTPEWRATCGCVFGQPTITVKFSLSASGVVISYSPALQSGAPTITRV